MSLDLNQFEPQRHHAVPLYFQLKQFILQKITSGALQVDECLPTEIELSREIGISRATVRQALIELTNEGYLRREKGRGTFVCRRSPDSGTYLRLDSFEREISDKGQLPSTSVLNLRQTEPIAQINAILGLEPADSLLYLHRIRYADDEPIIILETYLPYRGYEALLDVDFSVESLYRLLETWYSRRVVRAMRELEAIEAKPFVAKLLHINPRAPICLVKSVSYDENDRPVEYTVARYRGDRNKFRMELLR